MPRSLGKMLLWNCRDGSFLAVELLSHVFILCLLPDSFIKILL